MNFSAYHRIVVKVGSALLVDKATLSLRYDWLQALVDDLAEQINAGRQVVLVTSAAVAVGRAVLNLGNGAITLEQKQAAAAAGQFRLMAAYQDALNHHNITAAQVLLTLDDTETRKRHLNARQTFETLLAMHALPIVNENDTVATSEIRFGDNDRLAARVAQMVSADLLILLSDIDGLYTANPRTDATAQHVPVVEKMRRQIDAMAGTAEVGISTGGMVTKLQAARIATQSGCAMIISDGQQLHPLKHLADGGRHTLFKASTSPLSARKKWLASMVRHQGILYIDQGAEKALLSGKSLLPAGVTRVTGRFDKGDILIIKNMQDHALAKGLANYPSSDLERLAGKQSRDISTIIGYHGGDAVVHRDDCVMLDDD